MGGANGAHKKSAGKGGKSGYSDFFQRTNMAKYARAYSNKFRIESVKEFKRLKNIDGADDDLSPRGDQRPPRKSPSDSGGKAASSHSRSGSARKKPSAGSTTKTGAKGAAKGKGPSSGAKTAGASRSSAKSGKKHIPPDSAKKNKPTSTRPAASGRTAVKSKSEGRSGRKSAAKPKGGKSGAARKLTAYEKALNDSYYDRFERKYDGVSDSITTTEPVAAHTSDESASGKRTGRKIRLGLEGLTKKRDAPDRKKKKAADKAESDRSYPDKADKGKAGKVNKKKSPPAANNASHSNVAHAKVRRRNRRRAAFINSMVAVVVAVFLLAAFVKVFFNVSSIEVNGDERYDSASIAAVCKFAVGDNILFINTDESEKQIVAQFPYIESCNIIRRLPSTVEINVTEAKAFGVVEASDNLWFVISENGKLLESVYKSSSVSDSDLSTAVSDSDISAAGCDSAQELALGLDIPLLEGLEVDSEASSGYISEASKEYLAGFVKIYSHAADVQFDLTSISYGDDGYEITYDRRISVVLGDVSDDKLTVSKLKMAYYIIYESGNVTKYEMGRLTFNSDATEVTYSPIYEQDGESAG